jgi:hypothetical protein
MAYQMYLWTIVIGLDLREGLVVPEYNDD